MPVFLKPLWPSFLNRCFVLYMHMDHTKHGSDRRGAGAAGRHRQGGKTGNLEKVVGHVLVVLGCPGGGDAHATRQGQLVVQACKRMYTVYNVYRRIALPSFRPAKTFV
jgi:hypothetical protein